MGKKLAPTTLMIALVALPGILLLFLVPPAAAWTIRDCRGEPNTYQTVSSTGTGRCSCIAGYRRKYVSGNRLTIYAEYTCVEEPNPRAPRNVILHFFNVTVPTLKRKHKENKFVVKTPCAVVGVRGRRRRELEAGIRALGTTSPSGTGDVCENCLKCGADDEDKYCELCPDPDASPDPHFRTFQGYPFDFHGACDLVLVGSSGLLIHIRTKLLGGWSRISQVAVLLDNNEVIEFGDVAKGAGPDNPIFPPEIFLNGTIDIMKDPELLAELVDNYRATIVADPKMPYVEFFLAGGQRIKISRPSWHSYAVTFGGHPSTLLDGVGLYGTYIDRRITEHGVEPWTDADLRGNGMLGRDGEMRFGRDSANAYGEQWRVGYDPKDTILFKDPPENDHCIYSRRRQVSLQDRTLAEQACAFLDPELDSYRYNNCVFDVTITGETSWAENPMYTEPVEPSFHETVEDQCITEGNECDALGGKCVWRCNSAFNDCVTDWCKGEVGFDEFAVFLEPEFDFVEGCACELPYGTIGLPSVEPSPSAVPDSLPTVPPLDVPTTEPSHEPTPGPSSNPSGPNQNPAAVPSQSPRSMPSDVPTDPTPTPLTPSLPPAPLTCAECNWLTLVLQFLFGWFGISFCDLDC